MEKKGLTLVEKFGASAKNSEGWSEAELKYHRHPDPKDQERQVWQNVFPRLATALNELWPPDYLSPIRVETKDSSCWLTGLESSPAAQPTQQKGWWQCTIDGQSVKTGPIHLAVNPEKKMSPRLTIVGEWKQSKHFPDFLKFRRDRWDEFKIKCPNGHDSPTLFFSDAKRQGSSVEVFAKRGTYSDYVATVWSLNKTVRLASGLEKRVSELLKKGWNSRTNLLPLPVASPVAIDLMIETKEGTVLVCDDKRSQRWSVSVSALPNLVSDGHDTDATQIIYRTIRRRTHEELGLAIEPSQISWMVFGVGCESGHTGFVGYIRVKQTEQQIHRAFEKRKERDEVRAIEFIPLEISAVQEFLRTRDCRYFLRLGLHLCLWRKFPKRVKICAR